MLKHLKKTVIGDPFSLVPVVANVLKALGRDAKMMIPPGELVWAFSESEQRDL